MGGERGMGGERESERQREKEMGTGMDGEKRRRGERNSEIIQLIQLIPSSPPRIAPI
jgi:hypothetical protein